MEENQNNTPVKPDNNMILAIFTTLCCCLPIGIYAIYKASKVNEYYALKQYDAAIATAAEAKKFSFIGIGLGLAINIIYFVLYGGAMIASLNS